MSYYAAPPSAGDAAAQASSNLSLNNDREPRYDAHGTREGGPPSYYPPSLGGPPYVDSPISGVVTGVPYTPSPAYSNPTRYDSYPQNKSEADQAPLY
ncbi:unnamed protein product [Calypogeia fissa]